VPKPVTYAVKSVVTRTPEPNSREYVLVTLTITCPVCGEIEMQLPGHHLRKIVELLRGQLLEFTHLTTHERAEQEIDELNAIAAELLSGFPTETKH